MQTLLHDQSQQISGAKAATAREATKRAAASVAFWPSEGTQTLHSVRGP